MVRIAFLIMAFTVVLALPAQGGPRSSQTTPHWILGFDEVVHDETVSVRIHVRPFNRKRKDVRRSPDGIWKMADGREIVAGSPTSAPTNEVWAMEAAWGQQKFTVPESLYRDLFNVAVPETSFPLLFLKARVASDAQSLLFQLDGFPHPEIGSVPASDYYHAQFVLARDGRVMRFISGYGELSRIITHSSTEWPLTRSFVGGKITDRPENDPKWAPRTPNDKVTSKPLGERLRRPQ